MKTIFAAKTVVGAFRKNNQDNFFLNGQTKPVEQAEMEQGGTSAQAAQAFAVCDGMGGETSGELAAEMAVETLKRYEPEHLFLRWRDYVVDANERICRYQESCQATVGTTLSAVVLEENRACAFNVGDSRIYLLRGGELRQLSRDHTEFQVMVDAGVLKQEDFSRSKAHNRLTQHLGISSKEMELEPNVVILDSLEEGDQFLLCSDGLYGVVSDESLREVLLRAQSPQSACEEFIRLALEQGSRDNITAMVIALFPEQAPGKGAPGRRFPLVPVVGGLLALLLALGLGAGWYFPKVPDLLTLERSEAATRAVELGLSVREEQAYSDSAKKGTVIAQSVPEGGRARRGSELVLTVSLGRERVFLPDTTGQQEAAALEQLRAEGFVVDTAREYSDAAEGTVLAQTPAGGREVVPGSKVKLTVSRGAQSIPEEASEAETSAETSQTQSEEPQETAEAPEAEAVSAQTEEPETQSGTAAAKASAGKKKSSKPKQTKTKKKKQSKAKKSAKKNGKSKKNTKKKNAGAKKKTKKKKNTKPKKSTNKKKNRKARQGSKG